MKKCAPIRKVCLTTRVYGIMQYIHAWRFLGKTLWILFVDIMNYLASTDIGWKSRVTVEVNVEWGMEISRMEEDDLMRRQSPMKPTTVGSTTSTSWSFFNGGIFTFRLPLTWTSYIGKRSHNSREREWNGEIKRLRWEWVKERGKRREGGRKRKGNREGEEKG